MLAYYRENRDTIRTMILVCTIGGCCFFVFGIIGSLESIWILQDGVTAALNRYLHFPTILFTLGIPLVSLLSSYYFWKFLLCRKPFLQT